MAKSQEQWHECNFMGPALFLLALELKIKAWELHVVQTTQQTPKLRAVCEMPVAHPSSTGHSLQCLFKSFKKESITPQI